MRRLLLAVLLALVLVAGVVGYALGSVPSADGFIHGCYANDPLRDDKNFRLLDDDQQDGQCPNGWLEVKLVGTADP